jgi:Glycopeptide antibiotics resistance protein
MYPRFLYPLLPYRSFVAPTLLVCVIVAPCWLGVRILRLRSLGRKVSLRREALLLAFVVYLAALAAVTLTPNHSSRYDADPTMGIDLRPSLASVACIGPNMPRGSTAHSFCVRNARGNFLLFFPLGILIPVVWRRFRFGRALGIAVGVSCSIELAQYVSHAWVHRTADINDVILNSAGAGLGLLLVLLLRMRPRARSASRIAESV